LKIDKTKKLHPSTIIPREFYVERGADKQIRDVVASMGRPGYVLVARQMGKTNLLLNAKRELSNEGVIFVYVDLSNVFPDIHQFFRNIIDVAVDSHPECFFGISEKLDLLRAQGTNRPAHKEHEQELRLLLRALDGKLVVCLDEIDALKKVDYSDSVFSLIRSTYFASRINYPEFNQLTYILSGVVEPNDIIKNKDISPFNIGEKIYLDDFSHDEYLKFIEKAQLKFSSDVIERVFHWTNGNPRMCWDVCSSLEDVLLSDNILTPDSVDSVIRKLYLTSYNLAPVDHIRQQVAEDKDVRTAIMNIHLNKSLSVNDAQRTKLYLSGIIRSDFSSSHLNIKNRIIEASLSESWIRSIEESSLSVSDAGDVRYGIGDYSGALKLYKEYISKLVPGASDNFIFFKSGECCFMLGDYDGAIDFFAKSNIKRSESTALYFRKNLLLGVAQCQLGFDDESIKSFEQIIDFPFEDDLPIIYYEALINICVPYFKKFKSFSDKILSNCKLVIISQDEIFRLQATSDSVDSLMFAAYHNVSYAYELLENFDEAKIYLTQSMNFSRQGGKLSVISELLSWEGDENRGELLIAANSLLNDKQTKFSQNILQPETKFGTEVYSALLMSAFKFGGEKLAAEFAAPLLQGQYGDHAIWTVISFSAKMAISEGNQKAVGWLYHVAINLQEDLLSWEDRKKVYLHLISLNSDIVHHGFDGAFLSHINLQSIEQFDELDVRIFYALINKNLDANYIFRAEKLVSIVSSIRKKIILLGNVENESLNRMFLPIDFLELRLLVSKGDRLPIEFKAAIIQSKIKMASLPPKYFSENFMVVVKHSVRDILEQFKSA